MIVIGYLKTKAASCERSQFWRFRNKDFQKCSYFFALSLSVSVQQLEGNTENFRLNFM